MISPTPAAASELDRRVDIDAHLGSERERLQVSELAGRGCCVVLLAEPGMGKSTVLKQLAIAAGTDSIEVRTFLNEGGGLTAATTSAPLFLDGFDEYRIDGSAADKVDRLATRLGQQAPVSWWLACRSEDWTERDLKALQRALHKPGPEQPKRKDVTNETRSVRMPVTTVRVVLTEEAHWAVETDDGRERIIPIKGRRHSCRRSYCNGRGRSPDDRRRQRGAKCPRFQRLRRSVGHLTALAFVQRTKPAAN